MIEYSIENKTQEEIEMMFDKATYRQEQEVMADLLLFGVEDKHIKPMQDIMGVEDVRSALIFLLALLGNQELGKVKYESNGNKYRYLIAGVVAKAFAGCKQMKDLFPLAQERYVAALNVVVEMDGIFYDIVLGEPEMVGDGQFRTFTYCKTSINLTPGEELKPMLNFYKFPLIENPIKWSKNTSGGYHLSEGKCTLNKGAADQPQQCLDVLNELQKNEYSLMQETNLQDLQNYIYTKMLEKYPDEIARDITKNTTTTAGYVFNQMKDRKFYFEWKFDFRGRMYSSGYDINLQGDKYRKGIVYPTIENFKDIKC